MKHTQPIALFVFSNDRSNPSKTLPELEAERQAISQLFESDSLGKFVTRTPDLTKIIQAIKSYQETLIIFHFSGHANGTYLDLETEISQPSKKIHKENLATVLRSAQNLKLVFLNGCATKGQVKTLFDIGIPAVIATNFEVHDETAKGFSSSFYEYLSQGASLREAFNDARITVESDSSNNRIFRSLEIEKTEDDSDEFPWGLYHQNEDILDWNPAFVNFNSQYILSGSIQFFQNTVGENSQYDKSNISRHLLASFEEDENPKPIPSAYRKLEFEGEAFSSKESIEYLWQQVIKHAIIFGDGGMGKTVSMIRIWESFLPSDLSTPRGNPTYPIPIYIPLYLFNDAEGIEKSNWILKFIAKNYLQEIEPTEETLNNLHVWVHTKWEQEVPKILFLLDGYNEVTNEKKQLDSEIQSFCISPDCGIQVIISSRPSDTLPWIESVNSLNLKPLLPYQIQNYLAEVSKIRGYKVFYPKGTQYEALRSLLTNPLILTLYSLTNPNYQTEQAEGAKVKFLPQNSFFELVWNFMESELRKFLKIHKFDSETQDWYLWIFRFLIPKIGYEMEKSGQFSIQNSQFRKILKGFLGEVRESIENYLDLGTNCTKAWEAIDEKKTISEISSIQKILLNQVRIIRKEGNSISFLHQTFRDFFSARWHQQDIWMSNLGEVLPETMLERQLPSTVRRILGQLEGEHYNVVQYKGSSPDEDWDTALQVKSQLFDLVERLKNNYSQSDHGLIPWNVVVIWMESRGEISGINLDSLHLPGVPFGQKVLNRFNKKKYHSTSFKNATLSYSQFVTHGPDNILVWSFLESPSTFIFVAKNVELGIWDLETGQYFVEPTGTDDSITSAKIDVNNDRVYVFYHSGAFIEKEISSRKTVRSESTPVKNSSCIASSIEGDHNSLMIGTWDGKIFQSQDWSCIIDFGAKSQILRVEPKADKVVVYNREIEEAVKIIEFQLSSAKDIYVYPLEKAVHANSIRIGETTIFAVLPEDSNSKIWQWNRETGKVIGSYEISDPRAHITSVQDEEKFLYYSTSRGSLHRLAFSFDSNELLFEHSKLKFSFLAKSPIDGRLITISNTTPTSFLRLQSEDFRISYQVFKYQSNIVTGLDTSPNNDFFAFGGMDSTIKEFSLKHRKCLRVFPQFPQSWISSIAYSPSSKEIASASYDLIATWHTESGHSLIVPLKVESTVWHAIGFDTTGNFLLIGGDVFATFDLNSRKIVNQYYPPKEYNLHPVHNRGFYEGISKDGKWNLRGPASGFFKEIHLPSQKMIRFYPRAVFFPYSIALSHKHPQKVIRCGRTSSIQERFEDSNDRIREFSAHDGTISGVAYTHDDQHLLSCAFDGSVKIWEADTKDSNPDPIHTIQNVPGLFIQGCDFRGATWQPLLTPSQEETLRTYGAILTDQDKEDWEKMLEELYPEP